MFEPEHPLLMEPQKRNETVLIVEEEPSLKNLIGQVLERQGYRLILCSGAKEAIEKIKVYCDEIDALITEVKLSGIDGIRVEKELHAKNPRIQPLFLLNSYDDFEALKSTFDEPEKISIQKPFSPSALAVKIRSLLDDGLNSAD